MLTRMKDEKENKNYSARGFTEAILRLCMEIMGRSWRVCSCLRMSLFEGKGFGSCRLTGKA